MGKIYGICDFRRGKIGDLVFRNVANKNIVSEKANYYPVNSAWLKKEEFKKYVLSLLNEGIPQVYVLNELPEEIYPYALIFIQNQGGTSIYVDKDGVRTEIKLDGESSDAVDIVNNVPENPRNNTIYFVNNPESKNKNIPKNTSEYDLYVCDNNELKQIVLKGEDSGDLAYVKKVCDYITTKSLSTAYDSNLIANKNVITSPTGKLTTADIPHAFVHCLNFQRIGLGSVSFYVYSYSSTELTLEQLGWYFEGLGCTGTSNLYPVVGQTSNNNRHFVGMYVTKSTSTTQPYNFSIMEKYNTSYYTQSLTHYAEREYYHIYPIF